MSEIDLESVLTAMVRKVNGTDPAEVEPARFPPGTRLVDDLDVDSLALVELAEDLEARFSVPVAEDDLKGLATFGELTERVRGVLG